MTEPQIDDRRRYKELWKELLYARVYAAGASAVLYVLIASALIDLIPESVSVRTLAVLLGLIVGLGQPVALAFPTALAKRGKFVMPLVAASVIVAQHVSWYAVRLSGSFDRGALDAICAAVTCATIGLVEGLLERSMATTYAGLIGGILVGAAFSAFVARYTSTTYTMSILLFLTLHLGIGVSLALGRWIRDLPKRKQEQSTQ